MNTIEKSIKQEVDKYDILIVFSNEATPMYKRGLFGFLPLGAYVVKALSFCGLARGS